LVVKINLVQKIAASSGRSGLPFHNLIMWLPCQNPKQRLDPFSRFAGLSVVIISTHTDKYRLIMIHVLEYFGCRKDRI